VVNYVPGHYSLRQQAFHRIYSNHLPKIIFGYHLKRNCIKYESTSFIIGIIMIQRASKACLVIIAISVFLLAGCAGYYHDDEGEYAVAGSEKGQDTSSEQAIEVAKLQTRLETLGDEIEEMIGDAVCYGDSDCELIGFGAKPCGGVWGYIPYSNNELDEELLGSKVAAYNSTERELNRLLGRVSDCKLEPKPAVGCVDGHCKIIK
jgi:hypothetical protein